MLARRRETSCLTLLFAVMFFFFNDTATTEIYTLSLHDALPIYAGTVPIGRRIAGGGVTHPTFVIGPGVDRKSTRLNSSHITISYAVFCLKKKICSTGPSEFCRLLLSRCRVRWPGATRSLA